MTALHAQEQDFRSKLLSYVPRLRAFAHTLIGSAAAGDDLAQEALLHAWRARASFVHDTNMEAWIFRILRNLHISSIRKLRRAAEQQLDEDAPELAAVDDPGAAVHLNDLRQALNRLPVEQREALLLIGAVGWSYEQAASHARCPIGTMKSRVFRARRTVAAMLETGLVARDTSPAGSAMMQIMNLARHTAANA